MYCGGRHSRLVRSARADRHTRLEKKSAEEVYNARGKRAEVADGKNESPASYGDDDDDDDDGERKKVTS